MAALTGTKIQDTYDGLLKVSDNVGINSTKKIITDGLGNNSSVKISSEDFEVGGFFFIDIDGNVPDSKIGIGTNSPTETLHVVGDFRLTARFFDGSNSAGTSGRVLMSTGSATSWSNTFTTAMTFDAGVILNAGIKDYTGATGTAGQVLSSTGSDVEWVSLSEIQGVDGSGTANYIPIWTDSDTLGNSVIYQSNSNIGIGTLSPGSYKLNVFGEFKLDSNGSGYMQSDYGDHRISIYDSSNNEVIQFKDLDGSSANQLVVCSSGVGIGTASPSEKLHVSGEVLFSATGVRTTKTVGTDSSLEVQNGISIFRTTNIVGWLLDSNSSNHLGLYNWNRNGYVLKIEDNTPAGTLYINASGNIGIGTTSPSYKLDVNGEMKSDGYRIDLSATTQRAITSTGTDSIQFGDAGVNDLRFKNASGVSLDIKSTGKVGIGTTNPVEKLQINSGDVLINNSTISTLKSGGSLYIDLNTFGTYSGRNFRILDNGTSLINVKQTGEVGIGTTSPDSKLEIYSDSVTDFLKLTSGGSSANPIKLIFEKGSSEQGIIEYNRNGDLEIYNTDNDGGVMIDGSSSEGADFYVNNSGNVGIGTSSPSQKLHVTETDSSVGISARFATSQVLNYILLNNTSGANHYLQTNSNTLSLSADENGTNGSVRLKTNNSTGLILNSSQNVGIGTTSPDAKLSVTSTSTNSEDIIYLKSGADNVDEYLGIAFETGVGGNGPHGAIRVYNGPSASDSYMSFFTTTDGGTLTQGLTQNHLGYVGIGTNSPSSTLTVNGTAEIQNSQLRIRNTSSNHQLTLQSNVASNARIMAHKSNLNTDQNLDIKATQIDLYSGSVSGGTNVSTLLLDSSNNATFAGSVQAENTLILNGSGNDTINTTNASVRRGSAGEIFFDAPGHAIVNIDTNNNNTDRIFAVRKDAGTSNLFSVNESGNATFAGEVTSKGLKLTENTTLYPSDASISYHSSTNAVYVNGAGNDGWLRLNASGVSNDVNAINIFGTNQGSFQTFKTGGSTSMFINSSGQIGIGTTSPQKKLDIAGGDIRLDNSKGIMFATLDANIGRVKIIGDESGDFIQMNVDNSNNHLLKLNTTGVGIGTTSPTKKLDVRGDVLIAADSPVNPIGVIGLEVYRNAGQARLMIHQDDGTSNSMLSFRAGGNDTNIYVPSSGSSLKIDTENGINAFDLKITGSLQLTQYGSGTFTGTATQRLAVDSSGNIIELAIGSGAIDGSGTATYLPIWTDSDTIGDSIISSANGDVTINGSDDNPVLYINPSGQNLGDTAKIQFNSRAMVGWDGYVTLSDNGQHKDIRLRCNTGSIFFQTSNTTRVFINSDGDVGIGTTSPNGTRMLISGSDTSPEFNTTGISDTTLVLSNSDVAYGTVFGTFGSGDGVIQQRRITSAVYYDLLLQPYGGNVGIGTTSPSEKLSISGGNIAVANGSSIMIGGSIGDTKIGKLYNVSGVLSLDGDGTRNIRLGSTTNGEVVRIDNTNGRVGIGTTSPSQKLEINGNALINNSSDGKLYFGSTDHYVGKIGADLYYYTSGQNIFYSGSAEQMRIKTNGNVLIANGSVGIGTTSPNEKLEVEGNILVTSDSATSLKIQAKNSSSFNDPVLEFVTWNVSSGASSGKIQLTNGAWNNNDMAFYTETSNSVTEKMRITSTGSLKFNTYGSGTFTGTATQRLAVDSSGNIIEVPIGSGAVDGSGTANTVTMWSDADTLTDAPITISGSNATFTGNITTQTDSSVLGGSGVVPLYVRSTGTVSYVQIQNSTTGSNTTSDGLTVGVNGSTAYIWQRENASLHLGTNDSAALTINSSQNVGIGTTSPGTNLDIVGVGAQSLRVKSDSSASIIIDSDGDNDGTAGSYLHYRDTGATKWTLYKETNNDFYLYNAAAGTYPIHAKANGHIVLMEDGNNLGVGVSSPSSKLEVAGNITATGSGNTALSVISTGGYSQLITQSSDSDSAYIFFKDTSGERARLYSSTSNDLIFKTNGGGTTALTLDNLANATFAGNLRTPAGGKIFLWTGHDSNFLQYNLWQASASGGMTIKNIASGGDIIFQTVSTTALTIDSSQGSTFVGRTDLQKDLRIRGNDSSGNLGVVRFLTDANNQLIIDTGNDGSNRTIIDGSGNATFAADITTDGSINVNRLAGGTPYDNFKISTADIVTTLERVENTGDANAGYGRLDFKTNAATGHANTGRGGFKFIAGDGNDILYLDNKDKNATFAGDILPSANVSKNLGSTSNYFLNVNAYVLRSGSVLQFKSNGDNERMRIDASGNVGIGTTSPSQTLQVSSDSGQIIANFNASNSSTATNNGGAILELQNINSTNGNQSSVVFRDSNGNGSSAIFGYNANHSNGEGFLTFGTRNSSGTFGEKMRITSGGNVGIGTTSPTRDLQIGDGSSDSVLTIVAPNTGLSQIGLGDTDDDNRMQIIADHNLDLFSIQTGGGTGLNSGKDRLVIDSSGKVGIGTTSPSHSLHVRGSITGNWVSRFTNLESTTGSNYGVLVDGGTNSSDVAFSVNSYAGSNYFRIRGDGNIGIGTTSPSEKLSLPDSAKIALGDSADLKIQHTGSESQIFNSTGQLDIRTPSQLLVTSSGGENMIKAVNNGAVLLYYDNSKKLETTSTGVSVTGTIASRNIPVLIHTGWGDDTSTTSNLIIPLSNSINETTVSAADGQHFFIAPSNMKVIKVIMKNVSGSVSSSFTTQFKLYKNGTNVTSSSEIANSTSAITWEPTTDNSFVEGDELSLVYQKSATSKYWREVSLTIVLELIHDI